MQYPMLLTSVVVLLAGCAAVAAPDYGPTHPANAAAAPLRPLEAQSNVLDTYQTHRSTDSPMPPNANQTPTKPNTSEELTPNQPRKGDHANH